MRSQAALTAALACGLVLLTATAGAGAADDSGSLSVDRLVRTAAAARSGSPEAVQAQYDAGRATEDRLGRLEPTAACRGAYLALARVAHGNVVAAEGFDRRSPALRARGEHEIAAGKARHDRAAAGCRAGFGKKPVSGPQTLIEPGEGGAFFGAVSARIPPGTAAVELRWRGRRVARQAAPRRGTWTVALPSGTAAGPGTLTATLRTRGGTTSESVHAWLLPADAAVAKTGDRRDSALSARLATIAAGFPGYAGIYVHDIRSGRTGTWNEDARFPAASTVKLGVLAAALGRYGPRPERDPRSYDMRALAAWSSNLAANRLLRALGGGDGTAGRRLVETRLRAMGAGRSTYPGEYRVGTAHAAAPGPPPLVSQRTTTAGDLGRALVTLHLAAAGNTKAQRSAGLSRHEARAGVGFLLDSQPTGDNVGLFRPWLGPSVPIAQKHGWISSARHTAAVVYGPRGPVVVVLMTYLEGLDLAAAQKLGQKVVIASLA